MEEEQIRHRFRNLNVWKSGGQRAPHKPLLLLYALGRYQQGKPRFMSYAEIESDVKQLIADFGPPRKSFYPEYPFWHLQSDGIWELQNAENIKKRKAGSSASRAELLRCNVNGGLKKEIYDPVSRDKKLLGEIAMILLEGSFPSTVHEDILQAVGIDIEGPSVPGKVRDPRFRDRILRAYEYKCAICGFNVRLGNTLVVVEAAHIKWHQAGGPDDETNGIALCSMHHKLFDRGVFTLSDGLIVKVSDLANGSAGLNEWLMAFHGKQIMPPQRLSYYPKLKFVSWHVKEVFKGYQRH